MRVCSAPRPSRQIRRFDLGNRIPAPGYLYVHVHGAAQAQVNGNTPGEVEEELATIASFHARHGRTGLLATTVVEDPKRFAASVAGVARSVRSSVLPAPVSWVAIWRAHLSRPAKQGIPPWGH